MHVAALGSERAGSATRRLRILCAEDNPQIGDILVCLLTRLGHDVRHARNGREAWELLARDIGGFDLVVTDHQMPELTGADLVGFLRQAQFGGRVVVYSSALNEPDRARYEQLNVDAIVEKSSVATQLLAAIDDRGRRDHVETEPC